LPILPPCEELLPPTTPKDSSEAPFEAVLARDGFFYARVSGGATGEFSHRRKSQMEPPNLPTLCRSRHTSPKGEVGAIPSFCVTNRVISAPKYHGKTSGRRPYTSKTAISEHVSGVSIKSAMKCSVNARSRASPIALPIASPTFSAIQQPPTHRHRQTTQAIR